MITRNHRRRGKWWRESLLLSLIVIVLGASSAFAASADVEEQSSVILHVESGPIDVAYNDEGDVWYWGDYATAGTPVKAGEMKDIIQVYTGSESIFVKKDGTVWSWRTTQDTNVIGGSGPQQLNGLQDVSRFESGLNFQAVLLKGGTVWVWVPSAAQSVMGKVTPAKLEGIHDAVSIAAVNNKLIMLEKDGSVWLWKRDNIFSQDIGSTDVSQIPGFSDIKGITVQDALNGQAAVLGVKGDGTVWGWGSNRLGQIGLKEEKDYDTAEPVPGLSNIEKVIPAGYGNFAIRKDGSVLGWGSNTGQLGFSEPKVYEPALVEGISDVVDIYGDLDYSSVLKKDGTVWTLGPNNIASGRGYDYNPKSFSTEPQKVEGLQDIVAITGSYSHTVAVRKDGTVWAWGDNRFGRLGDGTTFPRTTPVQINLQ